MKTASDPRHKRRVKTVHELFATDFAQQEVSKLTKEILSKREKIDKKIAKAAPAWPIENINKIDLSILRLAVYELDEDVEPAKVVIDEAVEIAKTYGSESSSSFINGVLGTIIEEKGKNK